jgi:enoyl-[acyl-carrier protein] reductase II
VRLLKNAFFEQVQAAEMRGAGVEELKALLGRGRAKRGMYEGDLEEGELEIGQVSAMIREIRPAGEIVQEIWQGFKDAMEEPLYKH